MSDAANGSANAGNPAPGAGDGGAGGAADWTASFPDDIRGVIQTKGWKSPADAIGSYVNLEKLMGADKAGRGVVLPKDDAPAEEWAAFHNRLGRPESPDGYKIPVPEGDAGAFAKQASQWFHEAGLTAKQAETLASKWNEHVGGATQQQQAQFEQQAAIDMQDLQQAWGDKFEANAELARRARREAGLSDAEGQAIERALGLKKAAEVFSFLGRQFAEAPIKGGEGAQRGTFGGTPEDARARISALKADTGWTAKYLSGDTDARSEFERLHRIAYPAAQ
jgi:hypothetical protein